MQVRCMESGVALLHPELLTYVVPKPEDYYDETDPLVVHNRWAFGVDEEIQSRRAVPPVTEVVVEQATNAPGEKRRSSRGK